MSFWQKNTNFMIFCVLAFAATIGISVVVAATPPGEPVPESQDKTNVRRGGSSVLFVHSRRRYHRQRRILGGSSSSSDSTRYRGSSSRRGSMGNRSYRGGGLFGGK